MLCSFNVFKNPDHKDFIPINAFNLCDISIIHRDTDIFNFIKAMSNLTVHLSTRYASEERPKIFPGIDLPFPFYNKRGKKCLMYGTGMVWDVMNFTDEFQKQHGIEERKCGCTTCKTSPTPMTQWFKVEVMTAKHVVFDEVEAQHTTCHLFYDSEEERNKIQEFKGETVRNIDENSNVDRCMMACYIHDLELGKKLEDMLEVFQALYKNVCDKYRNSLTEHPLTVIVSHPHGYSKHVTVGEMKQREEMHTDNLGTRYTYTAQTCPGSGGASVFIAGRQSCGLHPHSHRCKEGGLNMSGVWVD